MWRPSCHTKNKTVSRLMFASLTQPMVVDTYVPNHDNISQDGVQPEVSSPEPGPPHSYLCFLPSIFHCSPWLHLRYWGWVCVAEQSAHRNRMLGTSFFFLNVIFLLIIWDPHIIHPDHNHVHFPVLSGHPQHNLDLLSEKTKNNKKTNKQRNCRDLVF